MYIKYIQVFSVIISEISLTEVKRLFMQRAQVRYGAIRLKRDCRLRLRPRKDDTADGVSDLPLMFLE